MKLSKEIEAKIVAILQKEIPSLQAIYLFGSYANGFVNQESDIDIAFLSSSKIDTLKRWNIANLLARELLIDVDLINLQEANTVFRFEIISQGKRIYGSGFEVEQFEMLSYSFYVRLQEERKEIIENILEKRTVLGDK